MAEQKSGFEDVETPILLVTYGNLVRGLDRIAATIEDGTFNEVPKDTKGGIPPAQFGVLGLWMLQSVATELLSRGVPLPNL